MDRLKDNIDEKATQFGYIPYYEATLRDNEFRDMAQSIDQLNQLDPRRRVLLAVNPYVAKHAKLPPQPNVEQKMYDDFAIDLLMEAAQSDKPEEETIPQDVQEQVQEEYIEETQENVVESPEIDPIEEDNTEEEDIEGDE
jgi:hypothetical protein